MCTYVCTHTTPHTDYAVLRRTLCQISTLQSAKSRNLQTAVQHGHTTQALAGNIRCVGAQRLVVSGGSGLQNYTLKKG